MHARSLLSFFVVGATELPGAAVSQLIAASKSGVGPRNVLRRLLYSRAGMGIDRRGVFIPTLESMCHVAHTLEDACSLEGLPDRTKGLNAGADSEYSFEMKQWARRVLSNPEMRLSDADVLAAIAYLGGQTINANDESIVTDEFDESDRVCVSVTSEVAFECSWLDCGSTDGDEVQDVLNSDELCMMILMEEDFDFDRDIATPMPFDD